MEELFFVQVPTREKNAHTGSFPVLRRIGNDCPASGLHNVSLVRVDPKSASCVCVNVCVNVTLKAQLSHDAFERIEPFIY